MAFTYNTDGYAATGYFLAQEESFSATSVAVSTGDGDINSVMYLLGDSYSVSVGLGNLYSLMDLASSSYAVAVSTGSINSVMGLLGDGYAVAVSHARLSFPSIWQGKLSIIPSHTNYEIIPSHTNYEIRALT